MLLEMSYYRACLLFVSTRDSVKAIDAPSTRADHLQDIPRCAVQGWVVDVQRAQCAIGSTQLLDDF